MHDIAERGRREKVATGLHERNAGDFIVAQHLGLFHSQAAVKQRVRARVKVLKIAGEKDDPEGIAISPLDLYLSSMDEHSWRVNGRQFCSWASLP
jgi:hypothetical protein